MTNSVTTAFTSVTTGNPVFVRRGEDYSYTVSGGASATVELQFSDNAMQSWETVLTTSSNVAETERPHEGKDGFYRWVCTAYTSGTATTIIRNETDYSGAIASDNSTITTVASPTTGVEVFEYGAVARQTVLECTAVTVTISDDAGVAQYGGVQVYDFPEGMLLIKGAQVNGILTAGVTGTIIDNWDGDVALGTATATTGATLTGTEADIMPSVAVSAGASDKDGVVDAVSAATALTESGARWLDGTATAIDMFLNFVIDDDATHTAGTATFTGTIVFNWEMMGDN